MSKIFSRKYINKIYWNLNSFIWDDYLISTDLKTEFEQTADYLTTQLNKPGARILEIGCATGSLAIELAGRGFDVTGVDFSPLMISKAKKKINDKNIRPNFILADINDELTFGEQYFDLIICRHCFNAADDKKTFLTEVHKLCGKDGLLFVVNKYYNETRKRKKYKKSLLLRFIHFLRPLVYPEYKRSINKEELINLVTQNGFVLAGEKTSGFNYSCLFKADK